MMIFKQGILEITLHYRPRKGSFHHENINYFGTPEPEGFKSKPAMERRTASIAYDHVIFQFPLYWYSYPPLLKKWFDDVFTYGWAYGSKGDKLNGKKLGLAMSIGDKKQNYTPEGSVSFTVDEVIAPFKASAAHVGAIALPYHSVFGASFRASNEEINESAKEYITYILKYQE